MKTKVFIIALLLGINIVAVAKTQNPTDYNSQIDLSPSKLVELEKKLVKVENTKDSTKLMEEIEIEANKNLFLLINGKAYSANAIFTCQKLKPNFGCSSKYANDTTYVVENFSNKKISEKISNITAPLNPEYTTTTFQFYLTDAQSKTKPIPIKIDNTLKTKMIGKKEKVLFAIVKGKEDLFYKKYVWLIQP